MSERCFCKQYFLYVSSKNLMDQYISTLVTIDDETKIVNKRESELQNINSDATVGSLTPT